WLSRAIASSGPSWTRAAPAIDHASALALAGWRQYARCWPGRGRGGAGRGVFGVWGICARNDDSAGRDAPGAGMHILAACGGMPPTTAGVAVPRRPSDQPAAVTGVPRARG